MILLLLLPILINLYFCVWYVAQGDLNFYTDLARDFLLFQEIDQKKLVLMGVS